MFKKYKVLTFYFNSFLFLCFCSVQRQLALFCFPNLWSNGLLCEWKVLYSDSLSAAQGQVNKPRILLLLCLKLLRDNFVLERSIAVKVMKSSEQVLTWHGRSRAACKALLVTFLLPLRLSSQTEESFFLDISPNFSTCINSHFVLDASVPSPVDKDDVLFSTEL